MPDTAKFTLELITVEGTPAKEPDCFVGFMRTDGSTAVQAKSVAFPGPRTFIIPAFPQEKNLHCLIEPSLYQVVQSGFFNPNGEVNQSVTAVRLPDKWTPEFLLLAQLPTPRFTRFLDIVNRSTAVDVKHGRNLGNLTDAFDDLGGNQERLAKMALLNLYAVLTDEKDPIGATSWFDFVQQFVRIDQERFVAETDAELFTLVKRILDNLPAFSNRGFFTELSPALHLENFPERYTLTAPLITVKVRYEQGNLQLTMAQATSGGKPVTLLDCDMDEHSNIILHTGDFFIHPVTGGTSPVDMHEYIKHHDPEVVLGYDLAAIEAD
jgi:hypothetical protein